MKRTILLVLVALALLGAMQAKGWLLALPSPPEAAAADGFDAGRAIARLGRILGDQRPHPVDSAANDAVRERLIAELRGLGLDPRVTDDFACNGRRGSAVACARVRNLIATIGPREGRPLLLVSHYDSTPTGPGASDDGIGVATMLEVAAALRGQALTRPIVFLFNEGEESGLIGARAFMERDPAARDVEVAINLESRGVSGPAIMFETSRPNAAAIALYRAAVSRPVANSLSTDLYRLIPNSTDVTVFAERPWTILNFAVIGNETRYHSGGDTLDALSPASVQHVGAQTLQLATLIAAGEAPQAGGERLYTDIAGQVLIVLPLLFGLIVLGLLILYFGLETARRRALGRPLLAMAATLFASAALAFAGHAVIQTIRPGDFWRAWPAWTTNAVYASALAAAILALAFVAGTAERGRLRPAFWLLFTLLGGAICIVAPGAAIYFLLPPLAAAMGMALNKRAAWAEQAGAIAGALLLFLTFGPAVALFEELMSSGPLWAFAPLGAAMLLPALIEFRPLFEGSRRIFVVAGAIDLIVLGWLGAGIAPASSADRQQLFTIEYVWDARNSEARFAVNNDGAPVPFAGDWQRAEFPQTTRRRWALAAPAQPVPPPTTTLLGRRDTPEGRLVRIRLAANGAETIVLVSPHSIRLRAAGASGFHARYAEGAPDYYLRCAGRACDGAVLDLLISGPEQADFAIVGTRSGLPPVAAPLLLARPAEARPQYGPDATIAIGSIRL